MKMAHSFIELETKESRETTRPFSESGVKMKVTHSVVSDSLPPHGLNSPWNSPGQNTGVGSLSFLQGIFPTQGSNPGLPHCGQILYQLSHKGSPRILEWVAYPISSRSFQPRNQTGVSCIAGGFFINWAIRKKPGLPFCTQTDKPVHRFKIKSKNFYESNDNYNE